MTHGSLFSGIGGFDLAASWMGWENVFHCENNEFCQKILKQHFPNSIAYSDITKTDFNEWRGKIDIITGGFPCQPYSQAGKRKGKADDRHLWPEMLRAIREIQPTWIVGENVPGLLNWQRGMVLAEIKADLEAAGFEVFPPVILPACGKNAPHRRDRLWIVAHATSQRINGINGNNTTTKGKDGDGYDEFNSNGNPTTNSNGDQRLKGRVYQAGPEKTERHISAFNSRFIRDTWQIFPTQPPVCGGNDGVPFELYIINSIENGNKSSDSESKSKINYIIWQAMRKMWGQREIAEASPELFINEVCNSLSILPHKGGSIGWLQENKEAKELYYMWESFYSKSYEEAQYLQQKMLECYRETERRKKMEQSQRVNRIKALGNAVVPQVVYQLFKAIQSLNP